MWVGFIVAYVVAFGLMKLGVSGRVGAVMWWVTFIIVGIWSAIFSPWAKAKERENQQYEKEKFERQMREEEERHKREEEERRKREEEDRKENERQSREDNYLSHLFSAVAKLAKADGVVDEVELIVAARLFKKFNISDARKRHFGQVFRAAQRNNDSIYADADYIARHSEDPSVCVFFYELLWDLACADGILAPEEKEILRNICEHLHLPRSYFDINYRRRHASFTEGPRGFRGKNSNDGKSSNKSSFRNSNERQYSSPHRTALEEAYDILGCAADASDSELKQAYHKAAKTYHPDILRANNVPEELVNAANEKMIKLNSAWEIIRKNRRI